MVMTVKITAKKPPQGSRMQEGGNRMRDDMDALSVDLFTVVPAWELMPMSSAPPPASVKKPAPANDRNEGRKSGFFMIDTVNGR